MILPKGFDIFSALTGGYSEGLDAFRFFLKINQEAGRQRKPDVVPPILDILLII